VLVHVRSPLDEEAAGVDAAEERGEMQRLRAVRRPRVHEFRVVIQQLAQARNVPDRRRLVDVRLVP
jgi:hypothetical protein